MGIRFECPNGHRLNVKGFLAGKRGICPDCDARFIVPDVSAGKATLVDSTTEAQAPQAAPALVSTEPVPVAPPPLVLPKSIGAGLPDVWYVCPTSGEQYGPANTELMRSWVAEDRVSEGSWVWRTGWEEWKLASEALAMIESSPTDSPPTDAEVHAKAPTTASILPDEFITSKPRRRELSSRRERARKISIALGALVLLLSVALVLVLLR